MAQQNAAIYKMDVIVICIMKTVNPATLSFAEAILKEATIDYFILDQNASIIEGSIGVIPRRLMVIDEDEGAARRAFKLAGLDAELHEN